MGSEQKEVKPCTNNCGFWGQPDTLNLCSKCYKDFCIKGRQHAIEKSFSELEIVDEPLVGSSFSSSKTDHDAIDKQLHAAVKVVNRCQSCNKKVGLLGFKCKCGSTFCGSHRHPEMHECSFDLKSAARDNIAKSNLLIIAPKHNKI